MKVGVSYGYVNICDGIEERELKSLGNAVSVSKIFKNNIELLSKINSDNLNKYKSIPNLCIYLKNFFNSLYEY